MANENNKIKLLLLWDILSKNTDENHAMNADEIREELAKRGKCRKRLPCAKSLYEKPYGTSDGSKNYGQADMKI